VLCLGDLGFMVRWFRNFESLFWLL